MVLPGFFNSMTAQQMLNDQKRIFRSLPTESLTIGTQTVPCIVADDRASNDWINGGLELQDRAVVVVDRSTLDVPSRGTLANYREQSWRVSEIIRGHATSPLRINLEKAT